MSPDLSLRECLVDQLAAADDLLQYWNLEVSDAVPKPARLAIARLIVAHCQLREAVASELARSLSASTSAR